MDSLVNGVGERSEYVTEWMNGYVTEYVTEWVNGVCDGVGERGRWCGAVNGVGDGRCKQSRWRGVVTGVGDGAL